MPDGLLWYVPFEALQIQKGDEKIALIDKVRIRYAPTISLAVPDKTPRKRDARTAVVTGEIFPKSDENASQEVVDAAARSRSERVCVARSSRILHRLLLAKTVDRLVVLSDLDNDTKGPYDWAPLAVEKGKAVGQPGTVDALAVGQPRPGRAAGLSHAGRDGAQTRRLGRGNVPGGLRLHVHRLADDPAEPLAGWRPHKL